MKETYYFPHEYHTRTDPKCSALIKDYGMAGYGLYWVLTEILHEQGGKIEKFPKLYDGLSFELGIPIEALLKQIEALLNDYNLLQEDEKYIWSNRVIRNIEERKQKYIAKSQAGRIGGLRSGASRCLKQNEALLEANEQKERKGKEILIDKNHKTSDTGFKPPTLAEVVEYCTSRDNGVDPQAFIDHYTTSRWFRGKTKIRDWRACVRTWEQNNPKQETSNIHYR